MTGTGSGLGDLEGFRLDDGHALFVDFDGTLAELGPDPDAIRLSTGTAADLVRLASRLGGALALISGRDLRDLASRTPDGLWRAGGHGLEVLAPGASVPPQPAPPPDAVIEALREVSRLPGVRIEIKGPVAALHFRANPDAATACLAAAEAAAAATPDHLHQAGKMVVEVKPTNAHKGRALQSMAQRPPFIGRKPVMVGDDTTDEDAMLAAQALGGVGVKVGPGPSAARLRTPDPIAVRAWIEREVR